MSKGNGIFEYADPKKRGDSEKFYKISLIVDQKRSYEDYWEPDLKRYVINARALWGINYGMWPQAVIDELKSQNRTPKTFNVLLDKAETFIGSVLGNGYDIRYSPTVGKMDSLILKLQDMYYSDKKDMFWELSEMEALLDSSCGVGFESMIVSDRNHPFGNIAFRRRNPRRVLMNPSWKTQDVYDLHDWFTWGRFTVREIFELFPNVSDRLRSLREREKIEVTNYGIQEGVAHYKDPEAKWEDTHVVIEQHWIEKKSRQWEYDRRNMCFFPETYYEFHSGEDISEKMKYVRKMGLSQDDISLRIETKTTKYIRAICPSLDAELLLLDNEDLIQCGNVNLFPVGIKMDGQYQGLVDRLFDVNKAINEYEMTMDTIHKRGAKDSVIMDELLAGNDGEKKAEIERKWSENGKIIWAAAGTLSELGPTAGIKEIPKSTVGNDIFRREDSLLNMADKLSKVSAAEEARTQFAGEPNKMFENKIAIGKIGKLFYTKIYENHQKAKALSYAKQAKYTYAGIEREFASKDGGEAIKINTRKKNETGGVEIYDDISMLPDVKVSVSLARDGIDIRTELRQDFSDILNVINQDPNDRALKLDLLGAIMDTLTLPDEEKEGFKNTLELLQIQARLSVVASIKQMQAIVQPQPQQAPSAGGQVLQNIMENRGISPEQAQGEVPQQKTNIMPDESDIVQGTPQAAGMVSR
jgi:hypothetical protein